MGLWEEVLAFKKEHGLYFHPLHKPKEKVAEIEAQGRQCICDKNRKCVCSESLSELNDPNKMRCKCLLFITEGYLKKYGYAIPKD